MKNLLMIIGALAGMLAVGFGAYGAHGLQGLPAAVQHSYQTAVQYQFYHSLALLVSSTLMDRNDSSRWLVVAGVGFAVGLLLFCGSIYLKLLLGFELPNGLTPAGGVAFMVGWLALACAGWRSTVKPQNEESTQ